jgi:hypothetical protein
MKLLKTQSLHSTVNSCPLGFSPQNGDISPLRHPDTYLQVYKALKPTSSSARYKQFETHSHWSKWHFDSLSVWRYMWIGIKLYAIGGTITGVVKGAEWEEGLLLLTNPAPHPASFRKDVFSKNEIAVTLFFAEVTTWSVTMVNIYYINNVTCCRCCKFFQHKRLHMDPNLL